MENITLELNNLEPIITKEHINKCKDETNQYIHALHKGTGEGNDFLGWLNLPSSISQEFLNDIKTTAAELQSKADVVVVIGIGGSYLGAKAVIEGLSHSFGDLKKDKDNPTVLFAGQNIGEDYLHELREVLKDREFGIIVISKSGTTTEPAIAFRILKQDMIDKYGDEEAGKRIVAITDQSKGALRKMADEEGFKSYVIPDDVGGRFSVLTPVGLLPIAVAGIDIDQLVEGARVMEKQTQPGVPFDQNPAAQYAVVRNLLYQQNKKTEILAGYNPKLQYLTEWWKQLYGESEGKDRKGIFPASVIYTTDLHSMGQYVQEGERNLFETVVSIKNTNHRINIPKDKDNLDGLNYLANKRIDEVNKMAELGTIIAHVDGDVPNIRVEIPQLNEYYFGQLFYFFEKACGISGYMLGVNPFNQPGVEAYKKNMFALLEKPGYEEATQKMKERLK